MLGGDTDTALPHVSSGDSATQAEPKHIRVIQRLHQGRDGIMRELCGPGDSELVTSLLKFSYAVPSRRHGQKPGSCQNRRSWCKAKPGKIHSRIKEADRFGFYYYGRKPHTFKVWLHQNKEIKLEAEPSKVDPHFRTPPSWLLIGTMPMCVTC